LIVVAFGRRDRSTIWRLLVQEIFFDCIINYVLEYGLDKLSESNLADMLTLKNAATLLITTTKGALCVMLEKQEVLNFLNSFQK